LTEEREAPRPNAENEERNSITDKELAEIDIDIARLLDELEGELLAGKP
jgi:hypothetical protein